MDYIKIGITFFVLLVLEVFRRKIFKINIQQIPDREEIIIKKVLITILYVIALFYILSLWNVSGSIQALLASVGAVSFAVGLAVKDVLTEIINGVLLFIDKPFEIDDLIEVAGVKGRVKDIKLRYIVLENENGLAYIRTSQISKSVLKVYKKN